MNSLTLPDMAAQTLDQQQPLDWVGMHGIALPLRLHGQLIAGRAAAGVSLDDGAARGIHMSRLYLALEHLHETELSPALLRQVLEQFLASHAGQTDAAGRTRLVRHGHLPAREVQTGIVAVPVKVPRVRDRTP